MSREKMVTCPVCGEKFELESYADIGEIITCTNCFEELRIVRLNPIELEEVTDYYDDNDDSEDYLEDEEKEEW
ncbi:MAG: lysine biosynthesis protein LysW [Candidatus Omnitrophica bacterium]|nr:lysine biosynthesis protein LysW [Candidatus Omnitrophota bacterium]MCM8826150.1 lysine biosynthesis protein LysW [Candidatus Omnitrophota bacterium]